MGLFSKKKFVCEKCGKEFEARLKRTLSEACDEKAIFWYDKDSRNK